MWYIYVHTYIHDMIYVEKIYFNMSKLYLHNKIFKDDQYIYLHISIGLTELYSDMSCTYNT